MTGMDEAGTVIEMNRRSFIAGTALALGTSIINARTARSADAETVISSVWGADKPFQKVVDAFNAKKLGVTAVNRFDGDYDALTIKAIASAAAGRPPAMIVTGWKFGYFAKRTLGARDLREIDATRTSAPTWCATRRTMRSPSAARSVSPVSASPSLNWSIQRRPSLQL